MEWVDLGVHQEDCTAPSPIFLEVFNCSKINSNYFAGQNILATLPPTPPPTPCFMNFLDQPLYADSPNYIVVLSNNIFSLLYKVQSLKIWSLMGVVMRHPNAKQQSVWRKVSIQSQG